MRPIMLEPPQVNGSRESRDRVDAGLLAHGEANPQPMAIARTARFLARLLACLTLRPRLASGS